MKIQLLFIMHTTTTFITRLSELEAFKSTEELEFGITEFTHDLQAPVVDPRIIPR